ncbi:hypothetical protein ABKV19_012792 [Rosa sericea]
MAWLLIISSVVVIWIASLFKILHGSYSPSKGAFLNNSTNGGSAKKRNVLLVVAHPDDESMKLLLASSQRNVEAWELVSTNIFRKYSGPVDIWFSNLYSMQCSNEMLHCLVNEQPRKSFRRWHNMQASGFGFASFLLHFPAAPM